MRSDILLLAALASYATALPANDGMLPVAGLDLSSVFDAFGKSDVGIGSFGGLSAQCAAALGGGVLGCQADSIDVSIRSELISWLFKFEAPFLDFGIKKNIIVWLQAGDSTKLGSEASAGLSIFMPFFSQIAAEGKLCPTANGIIEARELVKGEVALASHFQASIASYLSGSIGASLSAEVRAGLGACAAGTTVHAISKEVIEALEAYLASDECKLQGGVKEAVRAWIESKTAVGVIEVSELSEDALKIVSTAGYIESLVEGSGALSFQAIETLAGWLRTSFAGGVEKEIISIFEAIVKGTCALDISVEERVALAQFLSVDKSLAVEIKSALLYWLSFGAESLGVTVSTTEAIKIIEFLKSSAALKLSAEIRAALWAIVSGEGISCLAEEIRAQLCAYIGGAAGVEIVLEEIEIIVWGWLTGVPLPGVPGIITITGSPTAPIPSASATGSLSASLSSIEVSSTSIATTPAVTVSPGSFTPTPTPTPSPSSSDIPILSAPTAKHNHKVNSHKIFHKE